MFELNYAGLLNGTRATPEVGRSMVQESDEGDDDTTQCECY